MRKPLRNASDKLKFVRHFHFLWTSHCDMRDSTIFRIEIILQGLLCPDVSGNKPRLLIKQIMFPEAVR
jgi:cell division FtsZ-interacting protein ZapD